MTLIGDSVADAIPGDDSAVAILRQGIDLDLEVAPCRRVEGDGCPYQGVRPPSAVQLVQSMGSKLGDNVVVAVGYNDFEDQYAGNIEDAIDALDRRRGQADLLADAARGAASVPHDERRHRAGGGEAPPGDRRSTGTSTPAAIRTGSRPTACTCSAPAQRRWRR